jgi:hypothetical protein
MAVPRPLHSPLLRKRGVAAPFLKRKNKDRLPAMDGTRNIKDSLFVALFNNEEAARELFNAIYNTDYGPETPHYHDHT